ncbi:MAG TPA: hypothetical protein VFV38_01465 [Ktedonobacteraceae bacterium]|nr:hypothetical protein [Ktedonobacteraceae bacterium]
MAKIKMRDMIIIVPGITGSVLQKNGKDIWAISGHTAWSVLTTLGSSLQQIKLEGEDHNADDLGDGVRATRLIQQIVIPGLYKSAGYSILSRLITENFEVEKGTIDGDELANFFEFPYDWRRDNRVSARKLQNFIEKRLRQWREQRYAHAKVILLAHSMGGLISRYYLEVLEGWKDCRALFTFGTPHRGSVNALNYLCNGYKKLFLDLSDAMRTFDSVYQLLPVYEMLDVDGTYRRVAEAENIDQISKERAQRALAFHREIEDAVNVHWKDAHYRDEYKTIPIVGTRQRTLQSALLLPSGKIEVYENLPLSFDHLLAGGDLLKDGDGTVPRVSATPIELSKEYRDTFTAERHSHLQSHASTLDGLLERLKQMQVENTSEVRGPEISTEKPAISLYLDDIYLPEEPIKLHAQLITAHKDWHPGAVEAIVSQVEGDITCQYQFEESEDGWDLFIEDLPSGQYQVEVRTYKGGYKAPSPVHDIFEILR